MGQTKTLYILIKGSVQGVGFRFFLIQKAQQLGITGYARNLSNGNLEVIAQSKSGESLNNFIEQCKRGPLLAKIESVDVRTIETQQNYDFFDIR